MAQVVTTPACIACGRHSEIELTDTEVAAMKSGALIQNAMPERSADERELMITGTHGECWDNMFGE